MEKRYLLSFLFLIMNVSSVLKPMDGEIYSDNEIFEENFFSSNDDVSNSNTPYTLSPQSQYTPYQEHYSSYTPEETNELNLSSDRIKNFEIDWDGILSNETDDEIIFDNSAESQRDHNIQLSSDDVIQAETNSMSAKAHRKQHRKLEAILNKVTYSPA